MPSLIYSSWPERRPYLLTSPEGEGFEPSPMRTLKTVSYSQNDIVIPILSFSTIEFWVIRCEVTIFKIYCNTFIYGIAYTESHMICKESVIRIAHCCACYSKIIYLLVSQIQCRH